MTVGASPPRDVFADVDDLCSALHGCGEGHHADRIQDAVRRAATGTELLMAVRHVVQRVIRTEQLDANVRARAKRVILEIDLLLEG